jgi:hypothetical protein
MVLFPRRYACFEYGVQKKPHDPLWMRGLRFPLSGYALPALSPDKKQFERKQKVGRQGAIISLWTRQVHSRESCCNGSKLSILENSVTCVTNPSNFEVSIEFKKQVRTYVVLGLAIYQAYVILALR